MSQYSLLSAHYLPYPTIRTEWFRPSSSKQALLSRIPPEYVLKMRLFAYIEAVTGTLETAAFKE
jgi:hypothetical protein